MKTTFFCLLIFPLLFFFTSAFSQEAVYSAANAHSHNDYTRDTAFYQAYRHGFGSIEADIFLVNDELYVAHDRKEISAGKTLRKMYLEPLAHGLETNQQRRIQLLIDIKGSSDSVLPVLVQQLDVLKSFFSSGRLSVLISGNRPLPANYSRYPGFIFFDDDLVRPHTKEQWERVGLVSLQFSLFSAWKGIGPIPEKDEDRLRRIINSVHAAGKGIRFWDAPDTIAGWKLLMKLGVDFIGTDKVEELSRLLEASVPKR